MINRLMHLKKFLFLGMVLVFTITTWAQTGSFKNGVKQGQIKVKFTPEMTSTLSVTTVNARTSGFTTGIQSVDNAAKATKASNMYRLFPFDPKFESKLRKHGLHLWYVVEIDETTDPKIAVAQFKQLNEVAVAEVEHEKVLAPYQATAYTPTTTPFSTLPFNDPLLKDQWHYENTGQVGVGDADANIFGAWQMSTGSNEVIVSVHDQGVDVSHVDLKANIWVNQAEKNGQPGVDDDANGYIDDINGYNFTKNKGAIDPENHGTHVAGTIAAVNNNGIGVSGVAGGNGSGNGVKVMSLQILGGAPIEKSYVYAANNGAVISQNSWGYTSPNYVDQSVLDAIQYFVEEAGDYEGSPMRGGIVLFAAGNSDSEQNWYPGYFTSTMAVASTGPEGKKAYYSNYGDWIEISAPGGDQSYGSNGGVLSTFPKDQYAYMQGTSMACPHMSGIAALALSNRNHQMTTAELWNKLLTGVVNIDAQNPEYIGKLGTGAVDAALAIKNSTGNPPVAITNLVATDISQELAKFSWTVPSDIDDGQPISFVLHYSTQPITESNLALTSKRTIENDSLAGKTMTAEVTNLLGLTHYYFTIISYDRWGAPSALSNIVELTTNAGPAIAVTPAFIGASTNPPGTYTWIIDASVSKTSTQNITIQNNADGLLRYSSFMRPRAAASSPTSIEEGIIYPVAPENPSSTTNMGVVGSSEDDVVKLYNNEPTTFAFTPITKKLMSGSALYVIGETDISLPNSAAAKFNVTEAAGFNLTTVKLTMKLTRAATAAEPIVVEIYNGNGLTKENRLLAQTYTTTSLTQFTPSINLNEQLYFTQGESFYVVFHFPNQNLFPIGVGLDADPASASIGYYSSNVGATWQTLDEAMNDRRFIWAMEAVSNNADLGTYLSLAPASGDVSGMTTTSAVITADANNLINGNYSAHLVIPSNDAVTPELRVPVYLKVEKHQPNVKMVDIVDYSSVFMGSKKSFDIVMDNLGFGRIATMTAAGSYVISGAGASQFLIEGSKPSNIPARDQAIVRVSFAPTVAGVSNATLTISGKSGSGVTYTYTISLFGVGAETSKIALTPETQTKSGLTIGTPVSANITVQNTGGFPLKYFIPGYDTKGVSDNWPSKYHKYGYRYRTNYASDPNPITYNFQDIKTTGVEITNELLTTTKYAAVDIGFNFPYYDKVMNTIYVAQKGFTTFDNSVRPINGPKLNNPYNPRGYISLLGTFLSFTSQGQVFYKKEADRLIIQYDNVVDGSVANTQSITAQMVLFSNGDIRFYYKTMGWTTFYQQYLNVLIENYDMNDGILIHDYFTKVNLSSGTALGFDYPGPAIITSITNGSGVLAPGASANVTVNMNTSTLVEGLTNRYINFISNDPANWQKNALVTLDITNGGVPSPAISANTIAFGDVYEGAIVSKPFTIKNNGTADVEITSMTFTNGAFTITGDAAPLSIKPGLYKNFGVTIPTSTSGALTDDLVITYSDGTTYTIQVTGNVVPAPAINADLSAVNQALNYKETASVPYNIQNTGASALEVSVTGKQWVTFDAATAPSSVTYSVDKENKGGVYQWIDIRKSGVHVDLSGDVFTPEGFWEQIDLPFPFEYYGTTYNKIQLGLNGIASFEAAPPVMIFSDSVPSQNFPGAYIMPYWTFGGFDAVSFPAEDVGVFYQNYEDKMIITWSYLRNNFGGMGDPMSAQLFLYKNGTMKFQYKVENANMGGDQTSQFTFIGLQKNSSEGIMISPKIALDYGTAKALAYIINPVKKHVVAAGETLNGNINFNSFNVYGGVYNMDLKIKSNAPNNEIKLKPVQLTVNALAVYEAPTAVDFGEVMIPNPNGFSKPIELKNTGSAPLVITNMKYSSGATTKFGASAYAYTYNYLPGPGNPVGWGWRTTSLTFCATGVTPPHTSGCNIVSLNVTPSEAQTLNVLYLPSAAGTNSDNLEIITNVGTYNIATTGSAYRAPGLVITATPINSVMTDFDSVATQQVAFNATNTNNGQGNLDYAVSIDFGRTASSSAESMATVQVSSLILGSVKAPTGAGISSTNSYNRTISHTNSTTPETFVGVGGSTPFTVATKYNAGPEGFSLSHVETFFRSEEVTSGKIVVEIRAGGNSPATASKVTEGSFTFNASSGNSGEWIIVPMDKVGVIYPNENFYVIVTTPLNIKYSQGVVTDPSTTRDRYFYYDVETSLWHDINLVNGFQTTGWLMLAAEQTAGVTSWLNVTSLTAGSLAPGAASTIDITIDGHFAQRGKQVANLVLTTNDPNKKVTNIPVSLNINQAPLFGDHEVVFVSEGEEATAQIFVEDPEANIFTIEPAQTYAGVTTSYADGKLTVVVTPDFETEGTHLYTFIATDEYNATSEMTLHVEVGHTNRAPEFVGAGEPLSYTASGDIMEYSIADFFADPDEDSFTYSVAMLDATIAQVFTSSDKFIVRPMKEGATKLSFVVTDIYGASVTHTLDVDVVPVLGIEDNDINFSITAYPNPSKGRVSVHVQGEIANEYQVRVINTMGGVIMVMKNVSAHEDALIDMSHLQSGIYFIEITDMKGRSTRRVVKE